jgi:hypothetical protein
LIRQIRGERRVLLRHLDRQVLSRSFGLGVEDHRQKHDRTDSERYGPHQTTPRPTSIEFERIANQIPIVIA